MKARMISFGLVLLFAQLLMFFNSEPFFGTEFAEEYNNAMLGYLIFYLAFFTSLVTHPAMKLSLLAALPLFFVFLFIGIVGSSILGIFSVFQVELDPLTDPSFVKGVLLYQVVFVSNVEECIFRALLPKLLPDLIFLGIGISSKILSAIMFGVFHFGAYFYLSETTGQNLVVLIITAIFAGLMFQAVRDKFGLPASMGLHAGINIANLPFLGVA